MFSLISVSCEDSVTAVVSVSLASFPRNWHEFRAAKVNKKGHTKGSRLRLNAQHTTRYPVARSEVGKQALCKGKTFDLLPVLVPTCVQKPL